MLSADSSEISTIPNPEPHIPSVYSYAGLPMDPTGFPSRNSPVQVQYDSQYLVALSASISTRDVAANPHVDLRINRQVGLEVLYDYPINAIVEYPIAASSPEGAVGHRFLVDPTDPVHPQQNIQYSLGGTHGGVPNVYCGTLLVDENGEKVKCKKSTFTCTGLKICKFYSDNVSSIDRVPSPEEHNFKKTLVFFCAMQEIGCAFDSIDLVDYVGYPDVEPTEAGNISRAENQKCSGKMIFSYNVFGQPRLQCQYWTQYDTAHLVLRNLEEFNLDYLESLISGNQLQIRYHEDNAFRSGYGPLAGCGFKASPSQQISQCPFWHRDSSGNLTRGSLRLLNDCPVTYAIYKPYNLHRCPQIVIISDGIHSHDRPLPIKTPPPIKEVFSNMLYDLGWKLADATPRKLMLDSGFMSSLKTYLQWNSSLDPPLSALHPSLGNSDRVRRVITKLRKEYFPQGTGFIGAQHLAKLHVNLPEDERYVRCAESYEIEGGKVLFVVICMSKAMAFALIYAQYVSIDTSFKRVHGLWQEFEMEVWDPLGKKSVVVARAFINSQSALAHLNLLRRIFEIATEITHLPVQFHHIHGKGFYVWTADAHKGQALGVGLYCEQLCRDLNGYCKIDPTRRLCDLSAYDHLLRFYRLCTVHFKRNIKDLKPAVPEHVKEAMYSLMSTSYLDLDSVYNIINGGGDKARAWLKDKLKAKYIIPAIHQPASKIPLPIWQASQSTTNGNEQSHRDINRDGINLTMLGGIMRGLQYDFRVHFSIELHLEHGIYMQDRLYTEYRRSERSVLRQVLTQRRVAKQSPKKSAINKMEMAAMISSQPPIARPVFNALDSKPRRKPRTKKAAPYTIPSQIP